MLTEYRGQKEAIRLTPARYSGAELRVKCAEEDFVVRIISSRKKVVSDSDYAATWHRLSTNFAYSIV
jgi:hypothetical protein